MKNRIFLVAFMVLLFTAGISATASAQHYRHGYGGGYYHRGPAVRVYTPAPRVVVGGGYYGRPRGYGYGYHARPRYYNHPHYRHYHRW